MRMYCWSCGRGGGAVEVAACVVREVKWNARQSRMRGAGRRRRVGNCGGSRWEHVRACSCWGKGDYSLARHTPAATIEHAQTTHAHRHTHRQTHVLTCTHLRVAVAANGVDLINEDDAGRVLLGGREQVAHTARAHAYEHLLELRAGGVEEGHTGLAYVCVCWSVGK